MFEQPISAISGASSMLTNLPDSEIRNTGFDVQVDARLITGNDYGLNLSGNISLNAGHDDDRAVELEQEDEAWGWLLEQGASLIQTDRPALLLDYLNTQGRR